jgi:hypothetical protein
VSHRIHGSGRWRSCALAGARARARATPASISLARRRAVWLIVMDTHQPEAVRRANSRPCTSDDKLVRRESPSPGLLRNPTSSRKRGEVTQLNQIGRAGVGHGLFDGRQRKTPWAVIRLNRGRETASRPATYHLCSPQRRETIAVPAMPSTRAAPVDRSMHRPFTNGPRSLIRTVTLRPVECEVTVT